MRNAGGEADARTSQAPEFRELEFSGIREFRRIAASGPGSGTPAQKFEGRNPQGTKARGNNPRRPRGRTACCPAGIRSVGVSGSRIVLEKDGSVLEFPKQPTHASGSSPRKRPLLRKPENGKLPDRTGTNRDSQPTGKNRAVGQPSDRNEQKWQNKNRLGRQAVPSRRTDTPFRKEAGRALRHETWIVYKQAPGRGYDSYHSILVCFVHMILLCFSYSLVDGRRPHRDPAIPRPGPF